MRAKALALVFVALLIVGCGEKSWSEYASDDGRFSVLMPGSPDEQTQAISTPVGSIDLHIFMVEKPDIAYMVAYSDYPQVVVEKATTDEVLEGARNGALAKIQGRLLSEDVISYDEHSGREIEFTAMDGIGLGRAVILLADNRLYQVLAVGAKDSFPKNDVKRFIDSFEMWD